MDEPDEAELREIYAALTIGEPDDPALADRVLARAARMPEAELPQRLESTIAPALLSCLKRLPS